MGCPYLVVSRLIVGLVLWVTFAMPSVASEGTLLVANRAGGSISFIDLEIGVEIARVPIGPVIPHEVDVSPDGRLALTTEYGPEDRHGRHVVLLDVATASVVGRVDLGSRSRPHTALFLPDGRHAVATMQESDRLALLDLETMTVVRTYPTGGREGHMVRVSPDGHRAYVTSRGAEGTLSIIFLGEAGRPPVVIATGAGAEGLAVTPDGGEVWVANRGETSISVVDTESLEVVATLDSRPFAGRVEMGSGYAILPNGGRGSRVPQYLRLWNVAARRLLAEVPLRDGSPQGGNFGVLIHDGRAFASDPGEGTIQVFDLDGLTGRRTLVVEHEAPDGLAWSPVRVRVLVE